ncbi:MAG: EAL domain-containing protein [Acidihalobacter sp.]|uniref:EAL domain-containing protein n=1 Tax=Acidihalobacter sp. TaxID=1872108 RepID=UPI00307F13C8
MTAHSPGDLPAIVGIALLDDAGRICSHNAALAEMFGDKLQGATLQKALPLNERMQRQIERTIRLARARRQSLPGPSHLQHAGQQYQLRFIPLQCAGATPHMAALVHVSQPHEREVHRQTLRSLHTLHEAIVKLLTEPDTHTLIRAVCRVLVKSGGYPLAWVASVSDARIEHMDSAADPTGYLDELLAQGGEQALFEFPIGLALNTGRPAVFHQGDHSNAPSAHLALAQAYGYQSISAFPVSIDDQVRGVMCVYSHQALAFKDTEYDTLGYVAEGLAYGLSRLEQRRAQQLTEDKLRQTTTLFEASREGQLVTDENFRIIAVNPALTELTGYVEQDLTGQLPSVFHSGQHDRAYYDNIWKAIESQGFWQGEIWNRCKDGSIKPFWLRIVQIPPTANAPARYVGTYTDIATLKETEARLEHLAHHDALTDLPNRTLLETRLEQALQRAKRHGNLIAILFLDLDGFKRINDSLGHSSGDRLLLKVAERLCHVIREEDTLARFGGDEFVVLVENLRQPEQASIIARQLLKAVAKDLELDDQALNLSASIGIAVAPSHGQNPHELIQNADTAMYRAKASGRNTYQYYTRDLTMRTRRQLSLENLLRNALERDEFHLRYQPLIDIGSGDIAAVEALLRWERQGEEAIGPDEFIPLAEERGLIVQIGRWVLEQACRQAVAWSKSDIGPLRVAVNVSGRQLEQRGFARQIDDLLLRYQLRPELLELEVTETVFMEHDSASGIFDYLDQLGLRLAIDDFGTGYSSLSRLTQLRPNTIKIDRSFIQAAPRQSDAAAITTAIIQMAHSLDMEVVAEGVETEAQLEFLRSRAANLIQGYHFTPPLKVDALEEWVRDYRRRTSW